MDRVAGMIKKAVYRSSGRRVRGEDDKIPAIKTVAPDLPLDVLRSMDIRVDPWLAPPCRSDVPKGRHSHRYLSFDPVTEHIASEMRRVLCSDKGKAGVLYPVQ